MIHKILKGFAPVAALAIGALATSGCDGVNISINGDKGVPLAELDTSGAPPTSLVLAGPDTVVVTDGENLKIDVEGDAEAVETLRFTLDDETLGVMRDKDSRGIDGRATVRVTMPSPKSIMLAGSGGIAAQSLAGKADVTIAGSGRVDVAHITADSLDVNVMGSGTFTAAGTAESLDLNVAGSGSSDMSGLKVERADINIAGSGDGSFASDGKVEANIMGSGTINVIGRATCSVHAMGSGKLRCTAGETKETGAPKAPETPAAPEGPAAPDAPDAPDA